MRVNLQELQVMKHRHVHHTTTVDGSEIRQTSWGKGSLSHYLQELYHHPKWLGVGFLHIQKYRSEHKKSGPSGQYRVLSLKLTAKAP